jgi:hypothetical protein
MIFRLIGWLSVMDTWVQEMCKYSRIKDGKYS